MRVMVFRKLRYYLKVWISIFRLSLSKATTYRFEVFTRFIRGVMLVLIQVVFIHAVVGTSNDFVGWSTDEMYLLLGVYNLINYVSWSIFSINLWRMEEKILKGDFDFLLMKPANSLFMAGFSEFFIDDAISGVSGLILVAVYLIGNYQILTLKGILFGLIAIFSAFLIWFSLETIFACFDFIKLKNGLRELKKALTNVARFPFEIWENNVRVLFFTIFPIAFVSAVPAGIIAGIFSWEFAIYSVLVSSTFFILARAFWNWSIKKYTSAGG